MQAAQKLKLMDMYVGRLWMHEGVRECMSHGGVMCGHTDNRKEAVAAA